MAGFFPEVLGKLSGLIVPTLISWGKCIEPLSSQQIGFKIGAMNAALSHCAVTSNTGYRLADGWNFSTGEPAGIGK